MTTIQQTIEDENTININVNINVNTDGKNIITTVNGKNYQSASSNLNNVEKPIDIVSKEKHKSVVFTLIGNFNIYSYRMLTSTQHHLQMINHQILNTILHKKPEKKGQNQIQIILQVLMALSMER